MGGGANFIALNLSPPPPDKSHDTPLCIPPPSTYPSPPLGFLSEILFRRDFFFVSEFHDFYLLSRETYNILKYKVQNTTLMIVFFNVKSDISCIFLFFLVTQTYPKSDTDPYPVPYQHLK